MGKKTIVVNEHVLEPGDDFYKEAKDLLDKLDKRDKGIKVEAVKKDDSTWVAFY